MQVTEYSYNFLKSFRRVANTNTNFLHWVDHPAFLARKHTKSSFSDLFGPKKHCFSTQKRVFVHEIEISDRNFVHGTSAYFVVCAHGTSVFALKNAVWSSKFIGMRARNQPFRPISAWHKSNVGEPTSRPDEIWYECIAERFKFAVARCSVFCDVLWLYSRLSVRCGRPRNFGLAFWASKLRFWFQSLSAPAVRGTNRQKKKRAWYFAHQALSHHPTCLIFVVPKLKDPYK